MKPTQSALNFTKVLKFRGVEFSSSENQIIATTFDEAVEDLLQQKAALSNVLEAAALAKEK